jgi:DNA modification methylase
MKRLICGNCLEVMPTLGEASVDSIVTDPPYGLSFMGKDWDHGVPGEHFWREALRVAKPGAYLLAFGGTRTFHRLTVAIEDAGWEIRDCVMWVYGSGFPKSHNLDGERKGWGTALKPAWEPIIVARKAVEGTVAANVEKYGTGAINVDGCRVGTELIPTRGGDKFPGVYGTYATCPESTHAGRWPANLIHDGGEEVTGLLGDAARFFYCPKASKKDREEGLKGMETKTTMRYGEQGQGPSAQQPPKKPVEQRNIHPTVKPTDLMRYLCRLVTPPGGTVLDPFMGSGSTGKAAALEGFNFIGIDLNPEYVEIAQNRIKEQLV